MITTKYTPLAASIIFIIVKCSIRCEGFYSPSSVTSRRCPSKSTTSLAMGLFDFVKENFLDSRSEDFVRLEKSNDEIFGPGPLILMYAVPTSMDDEELMDMAEDGMPSRRANSKNDDDGIVIRRLIGSLDDDGDDNNIDNGGDGGDVSDDALLDLTVGEALNMAMKNTPPPPSIPLPAKQQQQQPVVVVTSSPPTISEEVSPCCPVLYFSGVSNTEMMETYNIMSNEIYEETNGLHWPACAKAVKPAMTKSLRQVLGEISGDHADAMRLRREEAEKMKEGKAE